MTEQKEINSVISKRWDNETFQRYLDDLPQLEKILFKKVCSPTNLTFEDYSIELLYGYFKGTLPPSGRSGNINYTRQARELLTKALATETVVECDNKVDQDLYDSYVNDLPKLERILFSKICSPTTHLLYMDMAYCYFTDTSSGMVVDKTNQRHVVRKLIVDALLSEVAQ